MVKHTQTIRQQKPTNCLSMSDHFVGHQCIMLKNILSMHNAEKFPNTLNILRYSHRKIFKLRLAIF